LNALGAARLITERRNLLRLPRYKPQAHRAGDAMAGGNADRPANAISSLTIPGWFPKRIEDRARRVYARALHRSQEDATLVARLITDPRMETVWSELEKRERKSHQPTPTFHHKARVDVPLGPQGEIDIRYKVMAELLERAYLAAKTPRILQSYAQYAGLANQLRIDADRVRNDQLGGAKAERLADRLDKAAEAYDEMGKLESPNHYRAAVADIAEFMSERFGSRMYGLTATIASVALECEISLSKVREWFSRRKRKKSTQTMGKKAKKRSVSP
jgi:hypothetical protein